MIKDIKLLEEFEREFMKKDKLSFEEAIRIFEAMWKEGVTLEILPLKDPLEGIDVDIRIAKIINSNHYKLVKRIWQKLSGNRAIKRGKFKNEKRI